MLATLAFGASCVGIAAMLGMRNWPADCWAFVAALQASSRAITYLFSIGG